MFHSMKKLFTKKSISRRSYNKYYNMKDIECREDISGCFIYFLFFVLLKYVYKINATSVCRRACLTNKIQQMVEKT